MAHNLAVDSALDNYKTALKHYENLLDSDPDNINFQAYVATTSNNIGALLANMGKREEALACFFVVGKIYIQLKDPNIKLTVLNLKKLKDEFGENEFEKLMKEVEPRAEEIIREMLG
jgi:tetratricopeptide (TPR) repeat protein